MFATEDRLLVDDRIAQSIKALPKVELHRHLEGALRLDTLIDIAQQYDFEMPEYDPEMLRPFVQMMPNEPKDWKHFLAKFNTLRQFYLSPEIIHRIASEAVIDAAHDNITYMELRFTPSTLNRMINAPLPEVIGWVVNATQEAAQDHNIDVNLIVSINRHESLELGRSVLDAVLQYNGDRIVAFDLAGQEAGHPASPFQPLFNDAGTAGLNLTVHAGEWDGASSVRDAVSNLGATRIGHGIRAMEDNEIVQTLRDNGIALEVCPSSNVDSGAVSSLQQHPLPRLIQQKVITTINTDDPLISNITLSDEILRVVTLMGMTLDDIKRIIMNSAEACFAPQASKSRLIATLRTQLYPDPEPDDSQA